jgi:hypothetical protein
VRLQAPATGDGPGCFTEASLLAHLDAGDPRITSPHVLAHLDGCSRCRILIAEVVHALDSRPAIGRATFGPGDRVADRYEILRYVARGGMGEVYAARDLELGTTVALKTLIITALDDARAASRLKTEVVLARKVTHSNVCRILEFGSYRDPQGRPIPFLTMPFLEGETLEQRLARGGPIRGPLLRSLALDIVSGLEAIHQAGLVHRDLKTANVFVVKRASGEEQALVMDFGLARPFAETTPSGLAASGTIAGTLHYMAPEQLEGAMPTPAMDMYALGVVLFEMLTGHRPFESSAGEPGRAIRRGGPIPRPSRLSDSVDRVWDSIVARCLAAHPDDRLSAPSEIRARLTGLGPVAVPRRRGRRGLLALASAAVVTIGVGIKFLPLPRPEQAGPVPATATATATAVAASVPPPVPRETVQTSPPVTAATLPVRRRGTTRAAAGSRSSAPRRNLAESAVGTPSRPAPAAPVSPAAAGDLDELVNAFPDR